VKAPEPVHVPEPEPELVMAHAEAAPPPRPRFMSEEDDEPEPVTISAKGASITQRVEEKEADFGDAAFGEPEFDEPQVAVAPKFAEMSENPAYATTGLEGRRLEERRPLPTGNNLFVPETDEAGRDLEVPTFMRRSKLF
jgi:hypothetical protein